MKLFDGKESISLTKGQQVKQLTLRLGQMERERDAANKGAEKLKWQAAQLRVAINALGNHYKLTPEAMKEIVDTYVKEQESEYMKLNDEAKKKFMDDIKAGKAPEFTVVKNPEAGNAIPTPDAEKE